MGPQSYAMQIRELHALEIRRQEDYTERMQTVFNLRIQAINDGPGDDETKARLVARATSQFAAFSGREPLANG